MGLYLARSGRHLRVFFAKALETKHLLHGGTGRAVRVLNRRAVAQSLPMDMFAVLSKPRVSSSAFRPRAAHAHGSVV